jgi:hypothetical protein
MEKIIEVEWNAAEWYPVYEPGPSRQLGTDDKPWKYKVPEELWNKYVAAFNVFRPLLEELCESQNDF